MEMLNTRVENPLKVWKFVNDIRIGQPDLIENEDGPVVVCNPADIPALCRLLYAEAGLAWPGPTWIKVADRLPEKSADYLVAERGSYRIAIAGFCAGKLEERQYFELMYVAWQPLPAAFLEGDKP